MKPELLPKVFNTFAERYAGRPGGYTRLHKFGNRPGDNAPRAILELVDNPRDLRWEMTARAVGREVLREKLKISAPVSIINKGVEGIYDIVAKRSSTSGESGDLLRPKTRWNLQKVLKFRDQSAPMELSQKAGNYIVNCNIPSTSAGVLIKVFEGPSLGYSDGSPDYPFRDEGEKSTESSTTSKGWASTSWGDPRCFIYVTGRAWRTQVVTKGTCTEFEVCFRTGVNKHVMILLLIPHLPYNIIVLRGVKTS